MQIGQDSDGNVVIGNATIIATNVGAANGVIHVIDKFPLVNAAVNTSMVAALETAGDFGPFDDAKVTSLASFLLYYSSWCQGWAVWGSGNGCSPSKCIALLMYDRHTKSIFHPIALEKHAAMHVCA